MDDYMTQVSIPVNLAKDKMSGKHHAVLTIISSSDTSWLSLGYICVTWPFIFQNELISSEAPETLMQAESWW